MNMEKQLNKLEVIIWKKEKHLDKLLEEVQNPNEDIANLIRKCLIIDPNERPNIMELKNFFFKINNEVC